MNADTEDEGQKSTRDSRVREEALFHDTMGAGTRANGDRQQRKQRLDRREETPNISAADEGEATKEYDRFDPWNVCSCFDLGCYWSFISIWNLTLDVRLTSPHELWRYLLITFFLNNEPESI